MWIDSIVVMVILIQGRLMLAVFLLMLVCVVLVIKHARADFTGAWEAYEQGQYNIAVREFLRCAERGHDKCQLYLGDIYSYGHGTIVRKDKALEWYYSNEYTQLVKLRQAGSNGTLMVVEGVQKNK